MKNISLSLAIVLFLLVCVTTPALAVVVESEFNAGDGGDGRDGWIGNYPEDGYTGREHGDSGGSVTWYDFGGGGEGCLENYEPAILYHDGFVAADKFLFDWWSLIQGGYADSSISFDYKKGIQGEWYLPIFIFSYTKDFAEFNWWQTESTFVTNQDLEWHHYTITLDETKWVHIEGSKTWEDTLSNVTELFVSGDLKIGPESNYLDNFTLTLVPEPTTLMLLGFGGLALRLRSGQALRRKYRAK